MFFRQRRASLRVMSNEQPETFSRQAVLFGDDISWTHWMLDEKFLSVSAVEDCNHFQHEQAYRHLSQYVRKFV